MCRLDKISQVYTGIGFLCTQRGVKKRLEARLQVRYIPRESPREESPLNMGQRCATLDLSQLPGCSAAW